MSVKLTKNNFEDFGEILSIIENARENTFRAVNRELISMYWEIGKYISKRVMTNEWGKSVVQDFADFVQNHYVGIKGFSAQNIWRMKQFYETYFGSGVQSQLLEITRQNQLATSQTFFEVEKDCDSPKMVKIKQSDLFFDPFQYSSGIHCPNFQEVPQF